MSPFRYCLNASTIRGTPVARQIEVAALAGYGAIELWFDDVDAHVEAGGTIAGLRAMLDARGLVVPTVIYLGGWFDATDADWPRIKAECGVRLEQAAQLGSNHVIAGPSMGRADAAVGARHYRELLELDGARAAMEFLGFVEQFNTIESALEVVELADHPDGTVVVDPFHIFRGGGSVEGLAKLRGEQVAVAHFNDTPAQPPREQQHDADRVWPGEGHLDLHRYLALLAQIGFHGWLSLELFREDLWARDPLEVAQTGLEKMRAVVEAGSV
jgi:sugar phosphate isomerase/epimerase